MSKKRYVLVFPRDMYVKYIDGPAISAQKDLVGCLMFKSVKDCVKYALMNGIPERYLNELEYQEIKVNKRNKIDTINNKTVET